MLVNLLDPEGFVDLDECVPQQILKGFFGVHCLVLRHFVRTHAVVWHGEDELLDRWRSGDEIQQVVPLFVAQVLNKLSRDHYRRCCEIRLGQVADGALAA